MGYDELESLMRSPNHEISVLATALNNSKERIEAIERRQTELLDEIHKLKRESEAHKS